MARKLKDLPSSCPECGLTTGSFELRAYKNLIVSWRIDHTVPDTGKRRHCSFRSEDKIFKKYFKTINRVIRKNIQFHYEVIGTKLVFVKITPTKNLLSYIGKTGWHPMSNHHYINSGNYNARRYRLKKAGENPLITKDMKKFYDLLDD